jgi:hypothetical protein
MAVRTLEAEGERALSQPGVDDGAGLGNAVTGLADVDRGDDRALRRPTRPRPETARAALEQLEHLQRCHARQLSGRPRTGEHLGHHLREPGRPRPRVGQQVATRQAGGR